MNNRTEINKSIAEDYQAIAALQEQIANKESLLPDKKTYRTEWGFSMIYGKKFKEILEQLSKSEIKILWCVKEQFDIYSATQKKIKEVKMTAISIQKELAEQGIVMNPDTVRKGIKKLVNLEFIKPMSDSISNGNRSVYRLNPFVAGGQYSEHLGKLQAEWKVLFQS